MRKRAGLIQQKFSLVINLVRLHPVEELVETLRVGRSISKEQVIQESKSSLSL